MVPFLRISTKQVPPVKTSHVARFLICAGTLSRLPASSACPHLLRYVQISNTRSVEQMHGVRIRCFARFFVRFAVVHHKSRARFEKCMACNCAYYTKLRNITTHTVLMAPNAQPQMCSKNVALTYRPHVRSR